MGNKCSITYQFDEHWVKSENAREFWFQLLPMFFETLFILTIQTFVMMLSSTLNLLYFIGCHFNLAPNSGVSNTRPVRESNVAFKHQEKLGFFFNLKTFCLLFQQNDIYKEIQFLSPFLCVPRELVSSLMRPPSPFEFETPILTHILVARLFISKVTKIQLKKDFGTAKVGFC